MFDRIEKLRKQTEQRRHKVSDIYKMSQLQFARLLKDLDFDWFEILLKTGIVTK